MTNIFEIMIFRLLVVLFLCLFTLKGYCENKHAFRKSKAHATVVSSTSEIDEPIVTCEGRGLSIKDPTYKSKYPLIELNFNLIGQCKLEVDQYRKSLDELNQKPNKQALIDKIFKTNEMLLVLVSLDWLAHVINSTDEGKNESLYDYVYAKHAYYAASEDASSVSLFQDIQPNLKEASMAMFWLGRIKTILDAARCKDEKISVPTILDEMESESLPLKHFRNQSVKDQERLLQIALDLEEAAKNRPPKRSICMRSLEYMIRYAKLDPECKKCKKIKIDKMNTKVMPDDPRVKVEFISNEEWNKRREEFRRSLSIAIKGH